MRSIKFMLASMCFAAAMTGCSSDEQTSFDIEKVPGRATVQGSIVYNQGTTLENGRFVYDYKPASNLEVLVIVSNSDYDSNLEGETVFQTITDENGKYSIEIPAPLNRSQNVRIQTAQFLGTHTTIQRVNNEIKSVSDNVVYWATGEASMVTMGNYYADLECVISDTETKFEGYRQYATLKGKIGKNAEYYEAPQRQEDWLGNFDGFSNATVRNCFVEAPNADLMISVNIDSHKFVYNTTTNNSGEFTLNVPVQQFPVSYTYTVEIMPQSNVTYTHYEEVARVWYDNYGDEKHYLDYTPVVLDGWNEQYINASGTTGTLAYNTASYVGNIEVKGLIFVAPTDIMSEHHYNPYEFESNLPWMSELESLQ